MHVLVASIVRAVLPGFTNIPFWNRKGFIILLLLHIGPTEYVYYWAHRALHHHYLYTRYHSHHHASFVTEPVTGMIRIFFALSVSVETCNVSPRLADSNLAAGTVHPFAEHLLYTTIFAIPLLGVWAFGNAFVGMFYVYWLCFDFMNAIGHCNFEFMPAWAFQAFPLLKYLVYTPS